MRLMTDGGKCAIIRSKTRPDPREDSTKRRTFEIVRIYVPSPNAPSDRQNPTFAPPASSRQSVIKRWAVNGCVDLPLPANDLRSRQTVCPERGEGFGFPIVWSSMVNAPIIAKTRHASAPEEGILFRRFPQQDAGKNPVKPEALRCAAWLQDLIEFVFDGLTALAEFSERFVPLHLSGTKPGPVRRGRSRLWAHCNRERPGSVWPTRCFRHSGPDDTPRAPEKPIPRPRENRRPHHGCQPWRKILWQGGPREPETPPRFCLEISTSRS